MIRSPSSSGRSRPRSCCRGSGTSPPTRCSRSRPATWSPIADQEAERALTRGLTALLPGSTVVGEEAVAADPRVLDRVGDGGAVWIVDPVDGTNNFAAGKTPFAVMVALVRDGEPVASWILDVPGDQLTVAEAGSGAYRDGVRRQDPHRRPGRRRPARRGRPGTTCRRPAGRGRRERARRSARSPRGRHCAGYEYPAVATDEQQFAMFWRILPWDHVPGALIVREAGGTVRHLDGSPYRPTDSDRACWWRRTTTSGVRSATRCCRPSRDDREKRRTGLFQDTVRLSGQQCCRRSDRADTVRRRCVTRPSERSAQVRPGAIESSPLTTGEASVAATSLRRLLAVLVTACVVLLAAPAARRWPTRKAAARRCATRWSPPPRVRPRRCRN